MAVSLPADLVDVTGSRVFEGQIQPLVREPSNPVRSYLGMQPIIHTALCGLAAVLVLTGTAAAKPSSGDPPAGRAIPRLSTTDGAPVELAAQPGSEADKLARQLMAREIARVHAEGTDPLVLVGMGRLKDADELLFVQLQSPGDCGSAGCSTVSFRYEGDQWIRIMDTVSGTVQIAQSRHRGMPDLIVNGNRLVWDGTKYPG